MSGLMPTGPLAYQGTIAVPYIVRNFPPTTTDFNFNVPTVWIDPANNFAWMLTSKPHNVASWFPFISGGGDITFLRGNDNELVSATTEGIVGVIGDGTTITTFRSPNTNTLTISAIGGGGGVTLNPDTDRGSSITGTSLNIQAASDPGYPNNCGSSVYFFGDTTTTPPTMLLNLTDSGGNTIIGLNAGVTGNTASQCTGLGYQALASITDDLQQVAVGTGALQNANDGEENTAIGAYSLNALVGGGINTAVGCQTAVNLPEGNFNNLYGYQTGSAYTSTESSNILIQHTGVVGENNIMRIGSTGSGALQVNQTFIAGVIGATQPGLANLVATWNSGTEQVTVVPDGTSGQVLTTDGAGSLSWTTPSSGAITWSDQPTNFPAVANNGYFITGNSTATMPATPNLGDTIIFCNANGATFSVLANSGQTLQMGTTTSGGRGEFTSFLAGDSATFVYNDTTTTWFATPGFTGGWTPS